MKKIKKISSVIFAAATLATSACFPGNTALAVTYDPCDVNRDGSVTVRDAAAISSYLNGNRYEKNYECLDANKSLIVDDQDVQCVMSKLMKRSYSSSYMSRKTGTFTNAKSVSNYYYDSAADSEEPREYLRYSYIEKKKLSNYILKPAIDNNNDDSARGIIGTDDRYLAHGTENTGIVRLSTGGTGFVVGDHQLATVAHAVYKRNYEWKDLEYIQTYNMTGRLTNTKLTPVEVHVPKDYDYADISEKEEADNYDFALITVKEDLSNYVHFELGASYSANQTNYDNIPVYVTGCPQTIPSGNDNTYLKLYSGEGRVVSNCDDNMTLLHYDADATYGNSGSPVYVITKNIINGEESYTYTALAIHSYANGICNFGARMNKYLFQFYKNNDYINY